MMTITTVYLEGRNTFKQIINIVSVWTKCGRYRIPLAMNQNQAQLKKINNQYTFYLIFMLICIFVMLILHDDGNSNCSSISLLLSIHIFFFEISNSNVVYKVILFVVASFFLNSYNTMNSFVQLLHMYNALKKKKTR